LSLLESSIIPKSSDTIISTSVPSIDEHFYKSIFEVARASIEEHLKFDKRISSIVQTILEERLKTNLPLSVESASLLLHFIRNYPDSEMRHIVLETSRKLRKKLFANKVAAMVPIEMSSFCSSNCKFCGWRKDNFKMIRLRISEEALLKETKLLAEMGFTHFELAAGDDLGLIRSELPTMVSSVKKTLLGINQDARLSICLTPLPETYYARLMKSGLDAIFTWQETYDRNTYYEHITSGPKAKGLTEELCVDSKGDGYLYRMKSQEHAIRSGLQVGLGVMLGLSPHLESDILSTIIHGNKLIGHYRNFIEPLIIGLPIWNPTTTPETDNFNKYAPVCLSDEDFELISAIYLLSFPDYFSWVFPNCRVSKKTQLKSIMTAGCFTSTMVRLGPGIYLSDSMNQELSSNYTRIFNLSVPLTKNSVMESEQFTHNFDSHENFLSLFQKEQLELVSDKSFLLREKICG